MDFNGDLNLATLQPAPVFPELYQELWWYSGGTVAFGTSASSAGAYGLAKGAGGANSTKGTLYTLSSNWSATTQYAFEVAVYQAGGGTSSVALWDMTSNAIVSGSTVTTTSTTATVIRSGKFTLTPGHSYGVTAWNGSSDVYVTDASLIVFPSAPLTSPSVSAISLANPSGNTLKESYIPLWVMSSSYSTQNTGGGQFLQKGSTSYASSITSATKLYTLSSSWSASQKFALEASIWGSSGTTTYASLWDTTSNTQLTSTQISTTASTATVIRSGSFTLTPSHSYGVVYWGGGNAYITKAHLVALAQ